MQTIHWLLRQTGWASSWPLRWAISTRGKFAVSLVAVFLLAAWHNRGIWGIGEDVCGFRPNIGAGDQGIAILYLFFSSLACKLTAGASLGSFPVYAFNLLLLAPLAYLVVTASRGQREFVTNLVAVGILMVAFPGWFHHHIIEGYTAFVTYLTCKFLVRKAFTPDDSAAGRASMAVWGHCLAFGAVLGLHYTARQSSVFIPLAGFTAVLVLVALRLVDLPSPVPLEPALAGGVRAFIGRFSRMALVTLAGMFLYQKTVIALLRMFGLGFQNHTVGGVAFNGLGWVDNPFNVVWDDDFQVVQLGQMLFKGLDVAHWDTQSEVFKRLFLEVTVSYPEMLIGSWVGKLRYVIQFFFSSDTNALGNPLQPTLAVRLVGMVSFSAFAIQHVLALGTRYRPRDVAALERDLANLALIAGVLFVPIAVAPTYLVSMLTAAILYAAHATGDMFLIWWHWTGETGSRRGRIFFKGRIPRPSGRKLAMWGGLLLVVTVVCAVSRFKNSQLAELGFHRVDASDFRAYMKMVDFNVVGDDEKQRVIQRLMEGKPSSGTKVFLKGQGGGPTTAGAARLAIAFDDRVCVIAKFDRAMTFRGPYFVQGPRNSALNVMRDEEPDPEKVLYYDRRFPIIKLADGIWNGSFRMVCMSTPEGYFRDAKKIRVNAMRFISGSHCGEGLGLAPAWRETLLAAGG